MKKITYIFIMFVCCTAAFAQGEANNWYFGQRAAIRFNSDGSATPIPGSNLVTTEGCSSISNAQGQLLFYTDGRNVWDRVNKIMPNANYILNRGLLGDPSSTQSAIIVPKKGNPNIYYIFTVDEPHHENAAVYPNAFTGFYAGGGSVPGDDDGLNNGLNYSIVDLSVNGLNGSIGDVTTRNVHLLTYDPTEPDQAKYKCSEKITAVKNANGSGFWVISHFLDKFYAFKVDVNGVNTTPVITQIEPMVPETGYRRNSIGYLKASPDGQKIAVAHNQRGSSPGGTSTNGVVYLYDFDDATGMISNPVMISNFRNPYGIEFSAEAKKLYVAYGDGMSQYDLLSSDISGSEFVVDQFVNSGALQLGPNRKIYHSDNGSSSLNVINFPEEGGAACGYLRNSQNVSVTGTQSCTLGLPPFITSLFSAAILSNNTCLGQQSSFSLNVNSAFDSVTWNFGDGSAASTATTPTHTYQNPGLYNVIADVVKNGETSQISSEITVSAVPVANAAPTITECDPDNNNETLFNLSNNSPAILGAQNSTDFEILYFANQQNADANTTALNSTAFTNTANPQTIVARIQNKSNTGCYATTSFQISAISTPVITGTSYSQCDDAADGNDANSQVTFNLSAVAMALVQNSTQYTITFYATEPEAQLPGIPLPQNFYNTTLHSQVVYMRVVNTATPTCFTITPVTLHVEKLPPPIATAELVQCDLGVAPDGLTQFNLAEANALLTASDPAFTVSYYATPADVLANGPLLPLLYTNNLNPQNITAKVTNTVTGCYRTTTLTLKVNVNAPMPIHIEDCDDDGNEDGLRSFTLTDAGLEAPGLIVTYYATANDALLEQNAIAQAFTNTVPYEQSVFARIESNNACTALQEIKLHVRRMPQIDTDGEGVVCLNTKDYIALDAGITGNNANYDFLWSTGAITETIQVNEPGTYTVTVTDVSNISRCERVRTVVVTASDVATITGVDITDFTDNNTVTVRVQPGNNVATTYLYSLDLPNGPYQESNFFDAVPAGIHTVYVYDTQRCGVVSKKIAVLAAPKFFTPNGDNVNETWNIIGVNALFYQSSKIYIFDRFGKMLANVNPEGEGWNGIYNGLPMPATDYWYILQLEDGRTIKGHFSILR